MLRQSLLRSKIIFHVDNWHNIFHFQEGRKPGEMLPAEELLLKLQKTRYSWDELQERPLPEGVDPLKIETYLEEEEFEEVLAMSKEEFYALPNWKQIDLKKEAGLF